MQLKLRKLENEINSNKNRLFTHSKSIDPKTIQDVETPKFPEILIEHNEVNYPFLYITKFYFRILKTR